MDRRIVRTHLTVPLLASTSSPFLLVHREFQCSRDLLLREMRYFVEYLPSERNEKGPTEIAVHCDINVFETLMRYVKRGLLDDEGNVIKEPKIGQTSQMIGSVESHVHVFRC